MAPALVDRTWRSSRPEAVEQDLAVLWREIARDTRVARAVMSNLVVFRKRDALASQEATAPDTDPSLEAIVARHPSRVVVIEHQPDAGAACAPIAARVGVAIFGPPRARYAVEQIAVRSACAEASFPSIVRRFIRGDLPTSIWWTEDLARTPPLKALASMGRQLVYDSRQWSDLRRGIQALAPLLESGRIHLADVNWRRLTQLRLAVVDAAADLQGMAPRDVRILHHPQEAALASLMAAWLAAQLNWRDDEWPRMEKMETMEKTEAAILALVLGSPGASFTLTLHAHRIVVERSHKAMTIAVKQETDADAVAAELLSVSADSCLHDALIRLMGRFNPSVGRPDGFAG